MIDRFLLYDIQPTEPPWFNEGRLMYVLSLILHDREDELMDISVREHNGILYKLDRRHRMMAYHLLGEEEITGFIATTPEDRHDHGRHLFVDQRGLNDSNKPSCTDGKKHS